MTPLTELEAPLSSSPAPPPTEPSAVMVLSDLRMAWAAAALLPLPALVITDPADNADISCLYLGVACAWFATETFRHGQGLPASRRAWRVKMAATGLATLTNVALFVALGLAVGVRSRLPFPLIAVLSAMPALGLVPWLTLRVRQPYTALILTAMLLLAAKLAACVVARVVYGPEFIARGYVAADWRTAKLMITLFWSFTVLGSLGGLVAGYRRITPGAS